MQAKRRYYWILVAYALALVVFTFAFYTTSVVIGGMIGHVSLLPAAILIFPGSRFIFQLTYATIDESTYTVHIKRLFDSNEIKLQEASLSRTIFPGIARLQVNAHVFYCLGIKR